GHSLGHGLGLEVHEAPRLAKTNTEPLPADAVVTIEPGIYLAGQGGVRIEDDVHLDRKSTRLNSSHGGISYAVFCLKKKKTTGCGRGLRVTSSSRKRASRNKETS